MITFRRKKNCAATCLLIIELLLKAEKARRRFSSWFYYWLGKYFPFVESKPQWFSRSCEFNWISEHAQTHNEVAEAFTGYQAKIEWAECEYNSMFILCVICNYGGGGWRGNKEDEVESANTKIKFASSTKTDFSILLSFLHSHYLQFALIHWRIPVARLPGVVFSVSYRFSNFRDVRCEVPFPFQTNIFPFL